MILVSIRSAVFFVWFVAVSVVLHIGMLPTLLTPRRIAMRAPKWWCAWLLWGLKIFAGLRYEVRGRVPEHGVLIASKHMSMLDTLLLYLLVPDAIVVLKRELKNIPFYGWYASKMQMIFIDRSGHAAALRQMIAEARVKLAEGRALLIFPEGHRMDPGAAPDYKPGVAGLYSQLDVPCVPVALNSGLFWTGFIKKPGTVVIEFLEPIAPGLKRAEFMRTLEARIETATQRLLVEGKQVLAAKGIS